MGILSDYLNLQGNADLHLLIDKARLNLLIAVLGTVILSNASIAATVSIVKESGHCTEFSPLTFGILPFVSAEQLVTQFSPLIHYLSEKLQVPVRIETAPNFVEFARRTHEDKHYDILFTAPHFFPLAKSRAGYRLIARVDSPGLLAVIVAPKESNIHNIKDLTGKRLATVAPTSLATLLIRKYLSDQGIDPDVDLTLIATPTHDASLLSSYHGITDASALMQPPYEAASQQVRESMRIIAKTQRAPHIPISVSSEISTACGNEISTILLKMGSTSEGQNVLKHNRFTGFKHAQPEEYEKIRALLVQ